MRVTKGIKWVATCTENFEATVAFFRDVIGLEVAQEGMPVIDIQFARYAMIHMPNDVMFEILEPTETVRGLYGGPVVSFTVDDLDEARREMEAKQVEFVTPVIDDKTAWRWIYFRAPDGNIYQIQEPYSCASQERAPKSTK